MAEWLRAYLLMVLLVLTAGSMVVSAVAAWRVAWYAHDYLVALRRIGQELELLRRVMQQPPLPARPSRPARPTAIRAGGDDG